MFRRATALSITQFGVSHQHSCFIEIGTFNTVFDIVIIPLIHFTEPAFLFHPISDSLDEILHKPLAEQKKIKTKNSNYR